MKCNIIPMDSYNYMLVDYDKLKADTAEKRERLNHMYILAKDVYELDNVQEIQEYDMVLCDTEDVKRYLGLVTWGLDDIDIDAETKAFDGTLYHDMETDVFYAFYKVDDFMIKLNAVWAEDMHVNNNWITYKLRYEED